MFFMNSQLYCLCEQFEKCHCEVTLLHTDGLRDNVSITIIIIISDEEIRVTLSH